MILIVDEYLMKKTDKAIDMVKYAIKRGRKGNWNGLLTTDLSLSFLEAYETIGGLFTEVTNDTLELSVTDKIWAIILDFVLEPAVYREQSV